MLWEWPKVPTGRAQGWEERLETRIPGNVNVKGVSGKGGLGGGQVATPGPWGHLTQWKGDLPAWTRSELKRKPSERAVTTE